MCLPVWGLVVLRAVHLPSPWDPGQAQEAYSVVTARERYWFVVGGETGGALGQPTVCTAPHSMYSGPTASLSVGASPWLGSEHTRGLKSHVC